MASILVACIIFNAIIVGIGLAQEVNQRVQCETTKGSLIIEIYRDWAPLGADRFLELVKDGFYTDIAFFRCVKGFLTQFGISDKPAKKHWHRANIPDDPNLHKGIKKNYVSYAGGGPNTRSTQIFFAFKDLDFLGKEPWETPFGEIVEGQDTLDKLYKGYGDIPPFGNGPDQQEIHIQGNDYIRNLFPKTDFIKSCQVLPTPKKEGEAVAAAVEPAAGVNDDEVNMHRGKDVPESELRSSDGAGEPSESQKQQESRSDSASQSNNRLRVGQHAQEGASEEIAPPPAISPDRPSYVAAAHAADENLLLNGIGLSIAVFFVLYIILRYCTAPRTAKTL